MGRGTYPKFWLSDKDSKGVRVEEGRSSGGDLSNLGVEDQAVLVTSFPASILPPFALVDSRAESAHPLPSILIHNLYSQTALQNPH